jgi:hypothetical protein
MGSAWNWLVTVLHKPIGQLTLIDLGALFVVGSFVAFLCVLLRERD